MRLRTVVAEAWRSLTASLSTAVNAVKGLTREELVETLAMPNRKPSEFLEAFEQLEASAWYLHHTPEGRYYFDRQENLTKLLQSLANDAPDAGTRARRPSAAMGSATSSRTSSRCSWCASSRGRGSCG